MGIYHLSSQPDLLASAPTWLGLPGLDKVAHALVFGGLAAVVHTGLVRSNDDPPRRARWVLPIAFAVLYGISDEVHQRFVPHRSVDLMDLLADGAGALLAVGLLEALSPRRAST